MLSRTCSGSTWSPSELAMVTRHVAAVDLGASSGRVVLGTVGKDTLRAEVLSRFPNRPLRLPDGLHWDLSGLYDRALDGLAEAVRRTGGGLASVAVDSWAVDYGLLAGDRLLGPPYHYRDEGRTAGVDRVHAVVPQAELHARNGLQFLPFNTVYQLAADGQLDRADRLLLVPDLIGHWLTGARVSERTNASTTGLLEARSHRWDEDLIARLALPRRLFGELVDPGSHLGATTPQATKRLGQEVELVTVGSHDTASAVVATPLTDPESAYISCGTWGLVGVELGEPVLTEAARLANFTNELGVDGRVRFLTNVMGLWLLSETVRHWEREGPVSLPHLLAAAAELPFQGPILDVRDGRFLPPGDMPGRIDSWCREHSAAPPSGRAATVRCIVESLAHAFAEAVEAASRLSARRVSTVHVVGGGVLNTLLCQAIADRSGRVVVAGPVEATALGNILVQARACGAVIGELEDLRTLVAGTQRLTRYVPKPGATVTP
ncbi:MAG: rhamnulokinase [Sciscionella sp.]